MADTTRRLSLHKPTGGDPAAVPADVGRLADQLDDLLLGYDQGPLASRPSSGVEGRLYYATDDAQLYYDTGSGWTAAANQPGDVIWTARSESTRLGWLPCDGAAVSRTTYAALFSAIGTAHGAGDGRTTFNVPDMRDRVAVGAGGDRALGDRFGADTHTHSASIPSHTHTIASDAGHTHGIVSDGGHSHGTSYANRGTLTGPTSGGGEGLAYSNHVHTIYDAGTHSHGGVTQSAGSHAHGGLTGPPNTTAFTTAFGSTIQRSTALNVWIKV